MNIRKSSSVNKSSRRKLSSFKFCSIDENDDPIEIIVKILTKFCHDNVVVDRESHIAYLNILTHLLPKIKLHSSKETIYFSLYSLIKMSLWHEFRLVRTAGIRCLRYMMDNRLCFIWFLNARLDFLIMRCLDLSYEDAINNKYRSNEDIERIEIMRVLYKVSLIDPNCFPDTLIGSLIDIIINETQRTKGIPDIAFQSALMILCQLVLVRPQICFTPSLISSFQLILCPAEGSIVQNLNPKITEAVLLCQLKLLNHAASRQGFPIAHFQKFFSYFYGSDTEKVLNEYDKSNYTSKLYDMKPIDTYVSLLTTMLHSWAGLLYFADCDNNPLSSFLGMLKLGSSETRLNILQFLYEIFGIFEPPNECQDFPSCLRVLITQNSFQNHPNWCLDDGFLISQCHDCLPYISPFRLNLADNFQAILLGLMIQNGLFDALAQVLTDDSQNVSARAGVLFGCLVYQASILLPSDHPLMVRIDPTVLLTDPKCHQAIYWSKQIHNILEQGHFQISPFLTYLLNQSSLEQHGATNNDSHIQFQTKSYLQPSNIDEMVELGYCGSSMKRGQAIDKTQVVAVLIENIQNSSLFDNCASESSPVYDIWDWNLIMAFTNALINIGQDHNLDRDLIHKILRCLLSFLTGINLTVLDSPGITPTPSTPIPSNFSTPSFPAQFPALPLSWQHAEKAAFVFTDILTYIVDINKGPLLSDVEYILSSFRATLDQTIDRCFPNSMKEDHSPDDPSRSRTNTSSSKQFMMVQSPTILFADYELNYKCSSYLFLGIGRLTSTNNGEHLLSQAGLLSSFQRIMQQSSLDSSNLSEDDCGGDSCGDPMSSLSSIARLVLASLDYTRPAIGRALIMNAALSYNKHVRRYTTKFMRVLLRAKIPFFGSWGIKLLLKQLHDSDRFVSQEAFDVLQEACEDEAMINNLQLEKMNILHKGYEGLILFSRILSVPRLFENIEDRNTVDYLLDQWKEKYNEEYCQRIDESLMSYYTSYESPEVLKDDPDIGRSSIVGVKFKTKPYVILPCHPYSSLAEHREGLEKLIERGDLQEMLNIIQGSVKQYFNEEQQIEDDDDDIGEWNVFKMDRKELKLRSAMFAVCQASSTIWGADWASEVNLYQIISHITKTHHSLNVRGTGVICLGLLGSTRRGSSYLQQNCPEWIAIHSDRIDKWPLLLDVFHQWSMARIELRRKLQTYNYNHTMEPITSLSSTPNIQLDSGSAHEFVLLGGQSVFSGKSASSSTTNGSRSHNASGNTSRKISYELIDNEDQINKCTEYQSTNPSELLDIPMKPRANSSSSHPPLSSNDTNPNTVPTTTHFTSISKKLSYSYKFRHIRHVRDYSLGNASSVVSNSDSGKNTPSKHKSSKHDAISASDLMGLLTLKRIRRKASTFDRDSSTTYGDMSLTTSIKSNLSVRLALDKLSDNDDNGEDSTEGPQRERNKKFSSVINPRGHLNKYRGLVLPQDFSYLITGINHHSHFSLSSTNPVPIVPNKPIFFSGSKEPSSNDLNNHNKLYHLSPNNNENLNKDNRSQSDDPPPSNLDQSQKDSSESLIIRLRSNTAAAEVNRKNSNSPEDDNVSNDCHRNWNYFIDYFLRECAMKHRDTVEGLKFHSSDICIHYNCSIYQNLPQSTVAKKIELRNTILNTIVELLSLSPRTRIHELLLARLKSKVNLISLGNNNEPEYNWLNDMCLFTDICVLFTKYRYSRSARLFIFELFQTDFVPQFQNDLRFFLNKLCSQTNIRSSFSTRL